MYRGIITGCSGQELSQRLVNSPASARQLRRPVHARQDQTITRIVDETSSAYVSSSRMQR